MPATLTAPRRTARRPSRDDRGFAYVQTIGYFAAQVGLTIEALADRTGLSRDRIAGMVRGRLPVADEEALRLAAVLGVGPEEITSGPPVRPGGGAVSGTALLEAHDQEGRKLPGVVLTKVEADQARYELGLRDAPPGAPRTAARIAAEEGPEDMAWGGRTTWRGIFGGVPSGWSR
jgi:transcriptional regulator with XRE-family HTH domain